LDGYKNVYNNKHSEIGEMASRMNTGLEKLIEASESVDLLSKELVVKEKELGVANIKADNVSCDQIHIAVHFNGLLVYHRYLSLLSTILQLCCG